MDVVGITRTLSLGLAPRVLAEEGVEGEEQVAAAAETTRDSDELHHSPLPSES